MTFIKKIKQSEEDENTILKDLDLLNNKNDKVMTLLEHQKRKLCIAMSLIGDPKYIFLDEPTTNLDLNSKTLIWDLLIDMKKKGKTIIFTTNDMNEADFLAERKLILFNGHSNCVGTSDFLKNHNDIQYNLQIKSRNTTEVDNIIKKYIHECRFERVEEKENSISNNEIAIWKLPLSSTSKFSDIFNELESQWGEDKLIRQISIFQLSLEELYNSTEGNNKYIFDEDNEEEEEEEEDYENIDDEFNDNHWNINAYKVYTDHENLIIRNTNNSKKELPILKTIKNPSLIENFKYICKYRIRYYFNSKNYIIYFILLPVLLFGVFSKIINIYQGFIDDEDNYRNNISRNTYVDNIWNIDMKNGNHSAFSKEIYKSLIELNTNNTDNILTNYDTAKLNKICVNNEYKNGFISSILSSVQNTTYSFDIYYNATISDALPKTMNTISNSILLSKMVNSTNTISTTGQSFQNFTFQNYAYLMHTNYAIAVYIGISVYFSISIIGSIFIKERKNYLFQHYESIGISKYVVLISNILAETIVLYMIFSLMYIMIFMGILSSDLNELACMALSYILM
ncbi:hypothetical protein PIROE2DRAFT_11858 [Piromyces sp. E2]|nr:hypothetical protein PIROE2DRAFT_11858 [Piromyces sp. E2]|eukprot:OUM61979.1 hypothetical protein PIROE2DRAFT_11858 [Piromyces sp. E2]